MAQQKTADATSVPAGVEVEVLDAIGAEHDESDYTPAFDSDGRCAAGHERAEEGAIFGVVVHDRQIRKHSRARGLKDLHDGVSIASVRCAQPSHDGIVADLRTPRLLLAPTSRRR